MVSMGSPLWMARCNSTCLTRMASRYWQLPGIGRLELTSNTFAPTLRLKTLHDGSFRARKWRVSMVCRQNNRQRLSLDAGLVKRPSLKRQDEDCRSRSMDLMSHSLRESRLNCCELTKTMRRDGV